MSAFESYRPSGRIALATIPVTLGAGLVSAAALSWVYELALHWIPNVHVGVVATLALGGTLGVILGKSLRWSNCRSSLAASVLSITVLVAAVLFSHYWSYRRMLEKVAEAGGLPVQMARLVYTPERFIQDKVKRGWSVGRGGSGDGLPLAGLWVYVIWGVEAVVVLIVGMMIAFSAIALPFCEDCERWTAPRDVGAKRGVPTEAVQAAVSAASIEALVQARPVPGGPEDMLVYRVHGCEECLQGSFLTVTRTWQEVSTKGEVMARSQDLAVQVPVTQKQLDLLRFALKESPTPS